MSYKFPPDEIFYEEVEEPLLKNFETPSRSDSIDDFLGSSKNSSTSELDSELDGLRQISSQISVSDNEPTRSSSQASMLKRKLIMDFSIHEEDDPPVSNMSKISLQLPFERREPVYGSNKTLQSTKIEPILIECEPEYDLLSTPSRSKKLGHQNSGLTRIQQPFNLETRRRLSVDSAIQCDLFDPPSRTSTPAGTPKLTPRVPRPQTRLTKLGSSFDESQVGYKQVLSGNHKKACWQKSRQLSFDLGVTRIPESSIEVEEKDEAKSENSTPNSIDEALLVDRLYKKLKRRLKKEKSSFSFDSTSSDSDMDRTQQRKRFTWKEFLFGHKIRKWTFWSVVAFLSVLTLKDVYDLIEEYREDPKQADMKIVFNKSMIMPNITFCMSRTQAWSHFKINASEDPQEWDESIRDHLDALPDKKSFLNSKWDFRMLVEAYEVVSTLTSIERETSPEGLVRSINRFRRKESLETKRRMIRTRNVTFEELLQKVGSDTLEASIRRFERLVNDTEPLKTNLKISWLSQKQICFQPWFDEKNFKTIEDQGTFFTMVLENSVEKLEGQQIDCMSIDFHGRPSSLSRFMEGEGRIRDGYNDELCLGLQHEVKVEIRARYQMLENDDDGTACRNNGNSLHSEFNCRSKCRMELLRDICNCTAISLSYLASDEKLEKYPLCDYEACYATLNSSNFSEANCSKECYPDCNQIRYDIDHQVKGRSRNSDPVFTSVNIRWGSFEYLMMEQHWVWSVATFIAALGGAIGMWLGLSILSLIQGGTYIYAFLTESVIQKKIPIKRSASIKRGLYKAKRILTQGSISSELENSNTNVRKFSII